MSVDLYVLKKKSVEVLAQNGIREIVGFLQLVVENALAQDSQRMVDSAVKCARKKWEEPGELPKFVVQVGADGFPRPGSPIFKWPFLKRPYCFDAEGVDAKFERWRATKYLLPGGDRAPDHRGPANHERKKRLFAAALPGLPLSGSGRGPGA